MEFKYRAVGDRPTPTSHPLPTATYVSECSLPGSFPGNVPAPRVFRTSVPVNASEAFRRELEKAQIRREVEKEEIRREIIAGEMARRRELEEEVRREMALERALGIPMQRPEGFSVRERVSVPLNQRMNNPSPVNHVDIFGGPQPQLARQVHIKQPSTQTVKDKVIILAKPNADLHGAKRKALTLPAVDDREHSPFSLQKKPKQYWSCALCRVTTTSEKGLNDHLQGKKHKAKEASLRTKKIGFDARANSQTLQPCITPADTGILESGKEDQAVQKNHSLGGVDDENEAATEKEAGETNALATRKKFKFWCAICEVETRSETGMQSHKNGKKHLANMKKFSQSSGAGL